MKSAQSLISIRKIVSILLIGLLFSAGFMSGPTTAAATVSAPAATVSASVAPELTPVIKSSDKSLAATLDRISAAAAGVNTISSRMEQEKHLSAFSEVIKTSGHFAFQRPDCWRWELTQPVESGILVCGNRGRRWHENSDVSQSFKLADEPWLQHFAVQITAWTTADFTFLKEQYDLTLLTQNPPILKLVPKESAARRLISALEITFSADYRYVVKIIIRESGSDYTAINFRKVHINTPLPQGYFK